MFMGSWDKKIFTLTPALHDIYSTGFFTSITTLMSGLILRFFLLWLICFCAILCITPLVSDNIIFNNFCLSSEETESSPGFIKSQLPTAVYGFSLQQITLQKF